MTDLTELHNFKKNFKILKKCFFICFCVPLTLHVLISLWNKYKHEIAYPKATKIDSIPSLMAMQYRVYIFIKENRKQ